MATLPTHLELKAMKSEIRSLKKMLRGKQKDFARLGRMLLQRNKNADKERQTLLHALSGILNRYQDIEDVLHSYEYTDKARERALQKISKLNAQIGRVVARHLPG